MDPAGSDFCISDVVRSKAGRDKDTLMYVVGVDNDYLLLADGKGRTLEKPKRKKRKHVDKVLRSETRVAAKLISGSKVLNGELRRDLAFISRDLECINQGG